MAAGAIRNLDGTAPIVGISDFDAQSGRASFVKGFGHRQAYESPRRANPRAADAGLWGFRILAADGDALTVAVEQQHG